MRRSCPDRKGCDGLCASSITELTMKEDDFFIIDDLLYFQPQKFLDRYNATMSLVKEGSLEYWRLQGDVSQAYVPSTHSEETALRIHAMFIYLYVEKHIDPGTAESLASLWGTHM